jgi:hypothetical protein
MVGDWYLVTISALFDLWQGFLGFIPALIGAIIIFLIGWFVALGVGKLVTEILSRLKFNTLFEKTDWQKAFSKAKLDVNPAEFLGAIVKWILVVVFLLAAVEILGLPQFTAFLGGIVSYLPNVFVASLIFIVAVIAADISEKIVVAGIEKMKVEHSALAGTIVKWAIWVFSILAILYQLGVVRPMVQTLFSGIVAFFVIAFGLAFGLGGKDVAAEILQDVKAKLKND